MQEEPHDLCLALEYIGSGNVGTSVEYNLYRCSCGNVYKAAPTPVVDGPRFSQGMTEALSSLPEEEINAHREVVLSQETKLDVAIRLGLVKVY